MKPTFENFTYTILSYTAIKVGVHWEGSKRNDEIKTIVLVPDRL